MQSKPTTNTLGLAFGLEVGLGHVMAGVLVLIPALIPVLFLAGVQPKGRASSGRVVPQWASGLVGH